MDRQSGWQGVTKMNEIINALIKKFNLRLPSTKKNDSRICHQTITIPARQLQLRRQLQARQSADFYYYIDIVGTCNLRCPSCAVGNYTELPPKGRMPLESYLAILDKISKEHPNEKISIDLYNWGEPGLHKQLGEIIIRTKDLGYHVGLSTNLNEFPRMKEVVKASPSYIRISLSGYYNQNYQQTHKRGDINLVKANMHQLRYYMDSMKSETIVEVGFHIYRTNFDVDFWKMKELCEELDFIFAPVVATLMPVEKAVKACDGEVIAEDQAIVQKLIATPAERMQLVAQLGGQKRDCQFRKVRTTINFDGSVALCCATFEKDKIIADNFLDIPRKELQAKKYRHPFCKTCMAHSLDMAFTGVDTALVQKRAVSVLGPRYEQFLDKWNVSLEPIVELDGKELTAQETFDLALNYEIKADFIRAKVLYQKLLAVFPRHSEGFFKLGLIFENEKNYVQAIECYQSAINVWPTHQPYREALNRCKILR